MSEFHARQFAIRDPEASFAAPEPAQILHLEKRETRFETVVAQALRDEIGFDKKRAAAELGIEVRSLEYILNEDVKPSLKTARAIAKFMAKRGRHDIAAYIWGVDFDAEIDRRAIERTKAWLKARTSEFDQAAT